MAALHQALECLGPTSWDAVPVSQDSLRTYIQDIFKHSRLIIESIPEPPSPPSSDSNGMSNKSGASSLAKLSSSSTRTGTTDPQLVSLQKEWGKPIRMNNPKENPLDIGVYKLNGKDGRGAWFARRSVHDGLSFSRWKAKMESEIGETLRVRKERESRGLSPDNSIRGIGGEKRTEHIEVRDADDKTLLGRVEVYRLSAQFPGPTTARDFVTLMITTDRALETNGSESPRRSYMIVSKPCDHPDTPPRDGYIRGQYESVELIRELRSNVSSSPRDAMHRTHSFPIRVKNNSDDASDKQAPDQGSPKSRKRGKTESVVKETQETANTDGKGASSENGPNETIEGDDINAVEWIMVTRSDPGGSVPRWMVERGTPKSIVADAAKFVNWLCQDDHIWKGTESSEGNGTQEHRRESLSSLETNGRLSGIEGVGFEDKEPKGSQQDDDRQHSSSDYEGDDNNQQGGLMASVTNMINSGLETYAPRAVLSYIPGHSPHESVSVPQGDAPPAETDDNASVTSTDTFTSAESHQASSVAGESVSIASPNKTPFNSGSVASTGPATPSGGNNENSIVSESLSQASRKSKPTSREKDLAKLASRKREVEGRLAEIRSETESLGLPSKAKEQDDQESEQTSISSRTKTEGISIASSDDNKPSPEAVQAHKRASTLARDEAKLLKQLRKIESRQLKVASKIETQQRKDAERNARTRNRSEVENLRQEVQQLKNELDNLRGERGRWVDLVGSLQRENTRLVAEKEGVPKDIDRSGYGTD